MRIYRRIKSVKQVGLNQQIEPVERLRRLLQRNGVLIDEIILALCVFAFGNIRANGCARAKDLLGENRFLVAAQILLELDDAKRERLRFDLKNIHSLLAHRRQLSKMKNEE